MLFIGQRSSPSTLPSLPLLCSSHPLCEKSSVDVLGCEFLNTRWHQMMFTGVYSINDKAMVNWVSLLMLRWSVEG